MRENFEERRHEMMRELSKRHRENVVKRKISNMQKSVSEPFVITPSLAKKKIAVYGADSFFIKNFINTLKLSNDVIFDTDIEKLTECVLDTGIDNLVVDLDEPTDWRKSTDVFTTVKTINPESRFYVCTKSPDCVQALILEKQGAIIIKKPVDFDYLYRSMK